MVINTCIHILLTLLIFCLLCLLNVSKIFFGGRREDEYGPSSSFKNTSGTTINVVILICIYGKMPSPRQAVLTVFLRMYSQCSFLSAIFVLNFPKVFRFQMRRER